MNRNFLLAAAAACLGAAAPAVAHVGLEYTVAPAGSHYKATFKIGHGCATSPTREVAVSIPAGVRSVRPMPKPGWTLHIERARRAVSDAQDEVVSVRWTARSAADHLPDDQYDEFSLVGRMPPQPGPLYWPVQQLCAAGRHDWTQVPTPGQPRASLQNPAPVLEVLPAAGGSGHAH